MSIKRLAIISMLLAAAIVINYLESFIPVFIPGVKLGLANVIILIMLYEFKWHEALVVDILRILIVSLIRGSFLTPAFYMSITGGILSFIIMLIFSKLKFFSPIGVSVLGALAHSTGQVIACIIIISLESVIYYLPFIALLSVLTGVLSGIIVRLYLKRSITNKIIGDEKIWKRKYLYFCF